MTKPSKARIRHAFERAAPTYDSAAGIQRAICHDLLDALRATHRALAPEMLLDAGCGTGYALPLLAAAFPSAQPIALDLSHAMLQRANTPCWRIAGDLELVAMADTSIDLYWSSLAVQWCEPAKALAEAARLLRPGGVLALASLGPATFGELRAAFADVDAHEHTLDFHTPAELAEWARHAGFVTVDRKNSPKIAHYPDFKSLLRAVKAIGANQVGEGRRSSLMSRSGFARAEAAYESLRTPAGLPLTYDVITLIAQK